MSTWKKTNYISKLQKGDCDLKKVNYCHEMYV